MSSKSNSISNTSTKSWTLKELEGGDYSDSDLDLRSQYGNGNDDSEPDSQYDNDNSEKNHSNSILSAAPSLAPNWAQFTVLFVTVLGSCTGFMTDNDLANHEGNKTVFWCIIVVTASCIIGILGALGMRVRQKIWAKKETQDATNSPTVTADPSRLDVTNHANQSTWSLRELEDESESDSDSDSESDESRLALLYKSKSKRRGGVVAEDNQWLKFGFAFCCIFVSTLPYLIEKQGNILNESNDKGDVMGAYWLENCVKLAMAASFFGMFVSFWHAARGNTGYRVVVGIVAALLTLGFAAIWIISVNKRTETYNFFGNNVSDDNWKLIQIGVTLTCVIAFLVVWFVLDRF